MERRGGIVKGGRLSRFLRLRIDHGGDLRLGERGTVICTAGGNPVERMQKDKSFYPSGLFFQGGVLYYVQTQFLQNNVRRMAMKHLMTGLCSAGLLVAVTGCQPELAQVQDGTKEAQWHAAISQSYSGFRPPRKASPAIKDNVSPKLVEQEQAAAEQLAADTVCETLPLPVEDAVAEDVEVVAEVEVTEEAAAAALPAPADDSAVAAETAAGESVEYVVKAGDTLSHIAQKFYGKASMAGVIQKANAKVLPDPNRLKPGIKLQIPKL